MNRHLTPCIPRLAQTMLLAAAALLILSAASDASPYAKQFISGIEAYQSGQYTQAIEQWEAIATGGVANGQLFYNLGNAYLKADHLGPAILWYERARRLLPNDPDLRFNLEYARSLTIDTPEESTPPIVRILFFWNYQLSHRTILIAAIAGNILFWLLIAGWRLTRRPGLLRAAIITSVPTLLFLLTAGYNFYQKSHLKQAIILPAHVSVRSGFQETDTELFVLHAGTKVQVVRDSKAHYQIRYSAGKTGWVDQDAVGLINAACLSPNRYVISEKVTH